MQENSTSGISLETRKYSSDSDMPVLVDIPDIESDTEDSMDDKENPKRLSFAFVDVEEDEIPYISDDGNVLYQAFCFFALIQICSYSYIFTLIITMNINFGNQHLLVLGIRLNVL